MKLTFKELYLFSYIDKKGKKVEFCDGINVITSSQENGTDRGKSVIMKSLYYTLGADVYFDDKWNEKNKIYILRFSIDSNEYYMYRTDRLFKLFNEKKELLFTTMNRNELANLLKDYFHFAVQLPNRNEEKLEIAEPVYNYLLYYLDQDYYNGTAFNSFKNLGHYPSYKENVLLYHFGVFNENYYNLKKKLEIINEEIIKLNKKNELIKEMLENVTKKLKGISFSSNIESLKLETNFYKQEYEEIVTKLTKIKKRIISLKNKKYDLEESLKQLHTMENENLSTIKSLNKHICPMCKNEVTDTLKIKLEKYNFQDDIILLNNETQKSILEIESKIDRELNEYEESLSLLNEYESKMIACDVQIDDALMHRGLIEFQKGILQDKQAVLNLLETNKKTQSMLESDKRKYESIKTKINKRYYELLIKDKIMFGLSEIDNDRFKNIIYNFKAGGSNKPISTVIWYCTLIKLKKEFNPESIDFPRLFDSPNNAETDDYKKEQLLSYLINDFDSKNQLIISSIGFDCKNYQEKEINIILLENEKYKLLNEFDYETYKDIMLDLCKK